jgi:glyoxylase-like metal-dependent hydrolase (beta-lactamase superfamily II)
MSSTPRYAVYAVRYATREARRSEHFYGGDPHDGPMPMDYFVWAAVSGEQTVVVDVGCTEATAVRRGRAYLRTPVEGLATLGIDAARVRHVVLTHLHYDHAGTLESFPSARFHLQDAESAYATGRCMCHGFFRQAFDVENIVSMVRHLYAGRVSFHDGMALLVPGLSVHHVGGHTAGLQVVRVLTRRGWVVLASDATHLYANMERGAPFPIVHSVAAMFEAYRIVRALADSADHVIPGHDPLVMQRYPAPSAGLEGIIARLDVPPDLSGSAPD